MKRYKSCPYKKSECKLCPKQRNGLLDCHCIPFDAPPLLANMVGYPLPYEGFQDEVADLAISHDFCDDDIWDLVIALEHVQLYRIRHLKPPQYISLIDYAERVKRSHSTVFRLVQAGRFETARYTNGKWWIDANEEYPERKNKRKTDSEKFWAEFDKKREKKK